MAARAYMCANGTMTGQRYIDEVLLPRVRLFRGAIGDKFVFMDDNATCHRTLSVQDCPDSEGIQRLVWPARSPDLNRIENVWDALGRQVAGRNYPPTNKNTLIRALTEEWDKLSQQLLDNVVQSMLDEGFWRRTTEPWSSDWTTELAPLLTTTPHQREDVSALDRFNVHRCPTRRVFSGTRLRTREGKRSDTYFGYRGHIDDTGPPSYRGPNV
ncbi:transposable element Tc3 transposase [Trichonephila clavipes]|nr:transposable element Tc3 transposase [Trichonephila clavipes]